jgi:hypothetical protein
VRSLFAGTLGSFCCIEAILLELDRELFWRTANFQGGCRGLCWNAMHNSDQKRAWSLIVIGLLALTFIGLVIAYKYTGDFSGLATLGTNRQMTPR